MESRVARLAVELLTDIHDKPLTDPDAIQARRKVGGLVLAVDRKAWRRMESERYLSRHPGVVAAYRATHLEQEKERNTAYRTANRQHIRDRHALWRAANKVRIKGYAARRDRERDNAERRDRYRQARESGASVAEAKRAASRRSLPG